MIIITTIVFLAFRKKITRSLRKRNLKKAKKNLKDCREMILKGTFDINDKEVSKFYKNLKKKVMKLEKLIN